jgi:ELWxxDGT repeat protein
MKKLCLLAAVIVAAYLAKAQTAELVADIYTGGTEYYGSSPYSFVNFQSKVFFIGGDNCPGGDQIYYLDASGTPVAVHGNYHMPSELCVFNSKLYFIARDITSNVSMLWEYNGINSPSVTYDFSNGSGFSPSIGGLQALNGMLYLSAETETYGSEPWKYDGINPPVMIGDINPGTNSSYCRAYTEFNGNIYFIGSSSANGTELWCYDNTNPPFLPFEINAGSVSSVHGNYIIEFGNKLYFSGSNSSTESELFAYDGINTPVMIHDLNPGIFGSYPDTYFIFNNQLYFSARDAQASVYKYSGTGLPQYVFSYNANQNNVWYKIPPVMGDSVFFFRKEDAVTGGELWKCNLSDQIELVHDTWPGSDGDNAFDIAVIGDTLYYSADDGVHGQELWKYSAANGFVMTDVCNMNESSYPDEFVVFDNVLFFIADDVNGRRLWRYEINGIPEMVPGCDSLDCERVVIFNNALYLSAGSPYYGYELFKYDGINPISLVSDIYPSGSSNVSHFIEYDNMLYFRAFTDGEGYELWKYDGTNPPVIATSYAGVNGYNPSSLCIYNNLLYFSGYTPATGTELFSFDWVNPPVLVADFSPAFSSVPQYLTVYDGKLYMSVKDNNSDKTTDFGRELWVYDGINAPGIVFDINTGPDDSSPKDLYVYNNKLIFNATNSYGNKELYSYDGINPPVMIDINPGTSGSDPRAFVNVNNKIFFRAKTDMTGSEIFVMDTSFSPQLYVDVITGTAGSDPDYMTYFNDYLFFSALDLQFGYEPHRVCLPLESDFNHSACFYFDFNGQHYTQSGLYEIITTATNGCDSTIFLNLTIIEVDTNVVQGSEILTASATGATYTWVDCNNGFSEIPGETGQSFSPYITGSYAVVVSQNGCSDTSGCHYVIVSGIKLAEENQFNVFPNPTDNILNVTLPVESDETIITIRSIQGRNIYTTGNFSGKGIAISVADYEAGTYIIEINNSNGKSRSLFIKN